MEIYNQIKSIIDKKVNKVVSPSEVKETLQATYGTNPDSVILSDIVITDITMVLTSANISLNI